MIQYLKNNEIDFKKYDACIETALNSRIYAYSWYLNCVADHWDALILNDYEAVMPLPWRQKYFIKYIYPPAWTQQLGVFSKDEIPEDLILNFIKEIPRKFKKITIQFNAGNKFQHKYVSERVNYILPLNKSYEEIYANFRKDRKVRINESLIFKNKIEGGKIEELISLSREDYTFLKISNKNYASLISLSNNLTNTENCFIVGVYTSEQKLLSGILFLKDKNRITNLFSVTNKQGKDKQIVSLLISNTIQKNTPNSAILDFEGSMIEGIADFYRSFGAKKETYYLFEKGLFY